MNRTGTREWSSHSVNIQTGCPHDCRYCYAASRMAECGIRDRDKWHLPEVRERDVRKARKKRDGGIMFPTSHDITPENLDECLLVIEKLLAADNQVLVVTKPHLDVVKKIAHLVLLGGMRERFELRCTIGAWDIGGMIRMAYWEPAAPSLHERVLALQAAHGAGLRTSISAEPALDLASIPEMVYVLNQWVTETIWVGLMNQVRRRVRVETAEDERRVAGIEAEQTPDRVRLVYEQLKDNPKVRWKDSIRKMLGLKES